MTTTLNRAPHAADGSLNDKAKVKESLRHMENQYDNGQEILIGVHRVDLADGTHQTIIHHKAA